jgi:hypothetical protein
VQRSGQATLGHIVSIKDNRFATGSTGSRIVATLCYPNNPSEGYTIFQSTIPRGTWRTRMASDKQKKKGERTAPR